MELSQSYKDKVIAMFPAIGEEWLQQIPSLIEKYINKFDLTNIKLLSKLTYNVLLMADSPIYGPVVLKIELPFKELTIRESEALILNNGKGACRCFYKNIDDGVVLLERLIPGYSLTNVTDINERIKIFKEVSDNFNIYVQPNSDVTLPSYYDILMRSLKFVEKNSNYKELCSLLTESIALYEDLIVTNSPNYLLHSDLHSENIIKSSDEWKAIDPHGFIGPKVLDTAIFIQKELDKVGYTKKNINDLLLRLKEQNFIIKDVIIAFYINFVLNICWDAEVNLDIEKNLKTANVIRDYLYDDYDLKLCKKALN